jgi:hypothetical protein
MFILKYKVGDDTFYRISSKQQPSGKSIAFDRPLVSHSLTSKIESSLKTIDSILAVKDETPKDKEKKAFVALVLEKYAQSLRE